MATYLIGDIHGCFDELKIILAQVNFYPAVDKLWLTGDLVSRGPKSLEVLRLVQSLGNCVRMVLGNHDLNLLSVYAGISKNQPKDRITQLLEAPDADKLINWLRHQPIIQVDEEKKLVMTHAGITPQWDLATAIKCAQEVESALKGDGYHLFLNSMYDNKSNYWNQKLSRIERMQFSTNVFTRMRYCFPNGKLEMKFKDIPEKAPAMLRPWFDLPGTISNKYSIVFGHWSSIKGHITPEHIYGLDTGCCWGGELTLLHWEDKVFTYVHAI